MYPQYRLSSIGGTYQEDRFFYKKASRFLNMLHYLSFFRYRVQLEMDKIIYQM